MVQIQILQGKMAGREIDASHFPFVVGRDAKAGLRLDDPGVWDRHLELYLDDSQRIALKISEQANASINGEPFKTAVMRNGDVVELGAAKLSFWITPPMRRNQTWREWMAWIIIVGIALLQVCIVYWLASAE